MDVSEQDVHGLECGRLLPVLTVLSSYQCCHSLHGTKHILGPD
jgi:hypothetical protein